MNVVNNFSRLARADLGCILRNAGDFSELSRVCQLFNEVVTEEATSLYAAMVKIFGAPCLTRAIAKIGLNAKSSSLIKVHGLFCTALQRGDRKTKFAYTQASFEALKEYMRPWLEAEALFKSWVVLQKNGGTELKEVMSKVRTGINYLENIQLFRRFFAMNPAEFNKITILNLSNIELKALPQEICLYFTHLKVLDLSKNLLMDLPEEIGNLSGLTDLRLTYNRLESLPREIGNLCSLQNFQCAFNFFKSVPNELCNLTKLRTLNLSCNRLCDLPEQMGNFQALNYLYLERNRLSSLPPSIGTIPYLIGLYLFDNKIVCLPDSLCQLEELKYLSAQSNELRSLPDDMGKMTSLYSLCIDNNKIKELPQSIASLINLRQLFFRSNEISTFPNGMGDLEKLDLISFKDNPIATFPDCMQSLPFWSLNPQIYPYLNDGRLQTVLNQSMLKAEFVTIYWRLGQNKGRECIDGVHYDVFGMDVYDKGLHGKGAEPGFLGSMIEAFNHLSFHCNHIIDAQFYLDVHKIACRHFDGKATSTLMGQEKVGKFRDADDAIFANFSEPNYVISEGAIDEFNSLNGKISLLFGSSFRIGNMILKSRSPKSIDINYAPLSRDQVHILFDFFLTEFYYDMGHAQNKNAQIEAIAKLIQRWEWLHPVRDGCGRTDTAFLNYLLTSYGFNPVLLKFPYVSSCMTLKDWTAAVVEGMKNWESAANNC